MSNTKQFLKIDPEGLDDFNPDTDVVAVSAVRTSDQESIMLDIDPTVNIEYSHRMDCEVMLAGEPYDTLIFVNNVEYFVNHIDFIAA